MNATSALFLGAGLGFIFFVSLWLSIRRLNRSNVTRFVIWIGMLIRWVLACLTFYIATSHGIWVLVVTLSGFLLMRWLIILKLGKISYAE